MLAGFLKSLPLSFALLTIDLCQLSFCLSKVCKIYSASSKGTVIKEKSSITLTSSIVRESIFVFSTTKSTSVFGVYHLFLHKAINNLDFQLLSILTLSISL